MKKNILVSVDRGETRVAVLEAKGSPTQAKRRKKAAPATSSRSPSSTWSVAAAVRSSATSTRERSTTSYPGWRRHSSTSDWSETALHVDEIVLPGGQAVSKRAAAAAAESTS